MRDVVIITGATSTGKTRLALELCKKTGGEIISADSRQIYKFLDIGTGKVPSGLTRVEKYRDHYVIEDIPIWGYDLVYPGDFFSAVDFAEYASLKINQIAKNKKIYIVGGTGFYIDILTGIKKPSGVVPDPNLRAELQEKTVENLRMIYSNVSRNDNHVALDLNNPVRLIRAIEKIKGKELTSNRNFSLGLNFTKIGLTSDRYFLYARADAWVDAIWQNGLLEEVRYLMNSAYKNTAVLQGLIYKETTAFLKDELSEVEAIQKIKFSLHAYIRRQQTYLKKIPDLTWLDINQDNIIQKGYNIING